MKLATKVNLAVAGLLAVSALAVGAFFFVSFRDLRDGDLPLVRRQRAQPRADGRRPGARVARLLRLQGHRGRAEEARRRRPRPALRERRLRGGAQGAARGRPARDGSRTAPTRPRCGRRRGSSRRSRCTTPRRGSSASSARWSRACSWGRSLTLAALLARPPPAHAALRFPPAGAAGAPRRGHGRGGPDRQRRSRHERRVRLARGHAQRHDREPAGHAREGARRVRRSRGCLARRRRGLPPHRRGERGPDGRGRHRFLVHRGDERQHQVRRAATSRACSRSPGRAPPRCSRCRRRSSRSRATPRGSPPRSSAPPRRSAR